MEIPPRMFTSEVVALARVSYGTLKLRQKAGTFPAPIDRGKELIFDGHEVYRALGLVRDGAAPRSIADRWEQALQAL